ncbi:hypothetical protein ACLKA7_014821 [Drosophila subpalustris]
MAARDAASNQLLDYKNTLKPFVCVFRHCAESVKISCSVMDRMLKLSDDEEHSCASKSRRASHNQLVQNRK